MIEEFTKRWFERNHMVREAFEAELPNEYLDIVTAVVTMLHDENVYKSIDPKRIHEINDGEYQGTLVYVIGSSQYQPDDYWYFKISYGSCSACDTLEGILSGNYGESEEEEQAWKTKAVDQLMMLALHIVQGLKKMGDTDD